MSLSRGDGLAGALPFSKLQGCGNDFVLIDARADPDRNWVELAEALCTRRWGVGSDGFLVLARSSVAHARMRMFNPDGSEDMCGNGLRCVLRYLDDAGELPAGAIGIEALSGVRAAEALGPANAGRYRVDMGPPRLAPEDMPALLEGDKVVSRPLKVDDRTFLVTLVSMGTPHAVIISPPDLTEDQWRHYSCRIERHPAFPDRITATWVTVVDRSHMRARFFERAVGPTLACGTGACAAVVAGVLNGLTDRSVEVCMPGGTVDIEWLPEDRILMTGPAERVFDGWWPLSPRLT